METAEQRLAREAERAEHRIYISQRDAALACVRQGRVARSFVAAGANDDLPTLHLSYSGDATDRHDLKLYDRSGALVNAADFYEFLRQQFREVYALDQALRRHVERYDETKRGEWEGEELFGSWRTSYGSRDFVHQAFRDAYHILKEEGHFNPLFQLWPLTKLFGDMDGCALACRLDEMRAKQLPPFEARYARAACEQANVPDVNLNIVLEFLSGTFLPREGLQPILDYLIKENVDSMHPEIRTWELSMEVFCCKGDDVPVWTAPVSVGCQASGNYYLDNGGIHLKVYREDEDVWDSDFEAASDSGGETDGEVLAMSDVEHEISDGELADIGIDLGEMSELKHEQHIQRLMAKGLSYGDLDKETRFARFSEAFAYLEEAASLGAVLPPLGPTYGQLLKLRPKRGTAERERYEAILDSLRANG